MSSEGCIVSVCEHVPCIRRISPQYERQSNQNDTVNRNDTVSSQLTKLKTMLRFLWPLLIVNLRIPGLI